MHGGLLHMTGHDLGARINGAVDAPVTKLVLAIFAALAVPAIAYVAWALTDHTAILAAMKASFDTKLENIQETVKRDDDGINRNIDSLRSDLGKSNDEIQRQQQEIDQNRESASVLKQELQDLLPLPVHGTHP